MIKKDRVNKDIYDLIIIGSGIAGMTAGIYASRAKLNFLIFEKYFPGGQGILTNRIENFPGFTQISGAELMQKISMQLEHFGSKVTMDEVTSIRPENKLFNLKTSAGTYVTKHIIIATGTIPKKLGIPGEEKFTGNGVSYCGTCDGALFPEKDVIVIGGGDTALEEALFISKFANKVTVIHRRDRHRALKILQEEAEKNPRIDYIFSSSVSKIEGNSTVERIFIKDLISGKTYSKNIDSVFIFIGYRPQTAFVKEILNLDENGCIITDENMETSQKGIFAVGDVRKNPLKQLVTAAGEGAIAAYMVTKRITGYY